MPLSLGQAIGGNFKQDYNVVDPLLKGFQIGEARQRRQDLIDLKNQQNFQKQNDALLSAAQRSINFTNLDPLVRDKYTEKARDILSSATVKLASNDPLERQQAKLELQGLIGLTGAANAESRIYSNLRTLSAKGMLPKEQENLFQSLQKAGDVRRLGEVKSPYWGGGLTSEGAFIATPLKPIDIDKTIGDRFGKYSQQHVSEELSQYPHLMNEFVGLPRDEADKKRVLGADYNKETASAIRTAEDELGDIFDNNIDIQNAILNKYDDEIAKKFPSRDGVAIVLNPEARLYARDKFIQENKDKATFARKTRSIPQEANRGGDLSLNFGGGGGGSPTSPITGDANAINVVTNIGGQDFTETVRTTNPQGFKSVSVISTNSNNVIDADNNSKFGEGKTFEEVEVGQAVAVPIAKQDIVDKNSGITFKKGQMVPEKYVKGSNAALVEYVPYAKGTALVKSGRTSEKRSVLIPLSDIGNSVIASQTDNNKPVTKQMLQNAINDAVKANNRLPKVKYTKKTTSSKPSSKTSTKPKVEY